MEGRLIAIDGVDGCGKGTQIDMLVSALKRDYPALKILVTKEPWDVNHNEIGKRIRKVMMAGSGKRVWADETELNFESLQYLFFLDRCVHYMKLIIPALNDGYLVITDRERLVTFAYGLASGVDTETIADWHKGIAQPDIYYYLKVSAETAINRIQSRSAETGQEKELFETNERVTNNVIAFDKVAKKNFVSNLAVINGDGLADVVSKELYHDLVSKLETWLSRFSAKQEVLFE